MLEFEFRLCLRTFHVRNLLLKKKKEKKRKKKFWFFLCGVCFMQVSCCFTVLKFQSKFVLL